MACAAVAGLLLAVALAGRVGLDRDRVWTLGVVAILAGLVASKFAVVAANWRGLVVAPAGFFALASLRTPLAFWFGLVAAAVAGLIYALRVRLLLWRTVDVLAPALALACGIASIACLAAGCGYGLPTGSRWGLVFTSRFAARTTGVPLGVPLYPVQLFAGAASLLICAALLGLLARRHRDGEVTAAWLFLWGIAQYFLEFYRGDAGRGSFFHGFATGTQLVAAGMVMAGGVVWCLAGWLQQEVE